MGQICVRLNEDDHTAISVRVKQQRTSTQRIGEKLWLDWLREQSQGIPSKELEGKHVTHEGVNVNYGLNLSHNTKIDRWVIAFRRLLETAPDVVRDAITQNVHAFTQLNEAVHAGYSISPINEDLLDDAIALAADVTEESVRIADDARREQSEHPGGHKRGRRDRAG